MKILKTLFGWLFNRWLISVIGLVIIALLIWFFGDGVAFSGSVPLASETSRLLLIIAVVFLWGLYVLVSALRQRRNNSAMLDSIAAIPAPAAEDPKLVASREEVAALQSRFGEALATLKQARLGGRGGRRFLYQLPWYLMIGPPGSGKTTALTNSGLKFPLAEQFGKKEVRGAHGTRYCDWFFTDEAVLIDTAGRYTTQDSDEAVDSSAWQGFLGLLQKHRSRRPIEGIIVALSITDITGNDPEERLRHARAVKRRVLEVYSLLKIRAPVYVIFNKCDLIAGFTEYFADLRPDEREQVWGTTFLLAASQQPNEAIRAFTREFAALIERLSARVIDRLNEESDSARRSLLLSFPQQMALLGPGIEEFLGEAFGQTRFQDPVLLRGVYLTSATQQGTPVDRVLGAVAASFGLERMPMPAFGGHGVSYFLTRLLKDVMFPESGLVTSTSFLERNRPWLLWGSYGAAAVALGLVALVMFGSYRVNRDYVDEVDRAVADFRGRHATAMAGRGDAADVLGTLDALRNLAQGYGGRDGKSAPLSMRLGLFQGDKLGDAADEAYRRGLQTLLLPRVMARLEQQIADNLNRSDFLYQALKIDLMMTTPERRDAGLVGLWVRSDFEARFPGAGNAELRETFNRHLQALLDDDFGSVPENPALVARARGALLSMPLSSRVYSEIRDQALAQNRQTWTLSGTVSQQDLQYFRPKEGAGFSSVPEFFTVKGYQNDFLKGRGKRIDAIVAETWVLGPDYERTKPEDERGDIERRVADLYFAEYIRRWEEVLKGIGLVPLGNPEQQANVLRALTQPASPLKAVLQAISDQTTLAASTAAAAPQDASLRQMVRDLQDQYTGKFRQLLGSEAQAATLNDPAKVVDDRFAPLHQLLKPEANKPAPIEGTLALLSEQQKLLEELQAQQAQGRSAFAQIAQTGAKLKAVSARMDAQAKFLPEPVKGMVTQSAHAGSAASPEGARSQINAVWSSNIAPSCQQALGNRYPFVKSSTTDANLTDFARVLGPNGEIDKFAKEYITPYAETAVRPWRWREEQGQALGIPGGSLRLFETAEEIRQGFFAGGGAQPQVRFEIEPVSLDPRASQVLFELGNQQMLYQQGPRRPQTMQWPPLQGSGAALTFTPIGNVGQTIMTSRSGPWALFHLLDGARIERNNAGDRLTVTFDVQGYQATYVIRADTVNNPFSMPEIQAFRCQDRL